MDEGLGCLMLIFGAFLLGLGLAALSAIPVYFLWNWLMPYLFGLPVINFWQAFGLSWLCACLFKSPSPSTSKSK